MKLTIPLAQVGLRTSLASEPALGRLAGLLGNDGLLGLAENLPGGRLPEESLEMFG